MSTEISTIGARRRGRRIGFDRSSVRMLFGALALFSACTHAQVLRVRPQRPVRPRSMLVLSGTLSVSVNPSSLAMTLSPQSLSAASPPVGITTTWANLTGVDIVLSLYGYFSSTTAALTNSGNASYTIPPSIVQGLVTGANSTATSYTSFSQTTPFSGASGLELSSINGALVQLLTNGSMTNTLTLQINLSTLPQLPAGSYSGTLNIAAQAL